MPSDFNPLSFADDPRGFVKTLWPAVKLYKQQVEIMESVRDNDETFVPAGHKLGKDFVAGATVLWWFLTHHPCRVVTTSVKDDHLMVLWGEIGRFLDTASVPLKSSMGGPLVVKHRELRKRWPEPKDDVCKISYVKGQVSEKGEGMAGHHASWTLLVVDEASGVEDEVYLRASSWAKRMLVIGNCYEASNFWKKAIQGGDIKRRPAGRPEPTSIGEDHGKA